MSFDFGDLKVPTPVQDMIFSMIGSQSAFLSAGAMLVEPVDGSGLGGHVFGRRRFNEDAAHGEQITGTEVTPAIIGQELDIAPVVRRVRARRCVDGEGAALGGLLSREPTAAVVQQTADYWSEEIDNVALSVLAALFDDSAGVLRSTHRHDVAADTGAVVPLSYSIGLRGAAKLGDAGTKIGALVCHSRQWHDLQAESAVKATFIPLGNRLVPVLGDWRVIVSDRVPVSGSGTYAHFSAFLISPGALWLATQQALREFIEQRASIPAVDIGQSLHFAVGARGVAWTGVTINPSDVQIAAAASWAKSAGTPTAATDKQIGIVALETNAT